MALNPYTPGAGFMPAYLAGRNDLIDEADEILRGLKLRYPQQSVIYYGLRGVGKTVLLNAIEESAENLDILYAHIEASEDGKFTQRLVGSLTKFTKEISSKERAKSLAQKCLDIIKAFRITYNMEEGSFGFDLNSDSAYTTGLYADDLTGVLVSLGRAAVKSEDAICIFIDEVQYLSGEEINGLIMAVHRCNQLRLPVLLICAGLPRILKVVGEACSYAERLFRFRIVDALTDEQADAAIRRPAEDHEITYTNEAVQEIIRETGGYPYFIQEFCSVVWDCISANQVTVDDVKRAEPEFRNSLDRGFFSVRYDRCTPKERDFMIAMVKCGDLPCSISNVAKQMHRTVSSISPYRAQLISKGMIYPTGHAEVDFTVPQFDQFIRRINPNLSISIG